MNIDKLRRALEVQWYVFDTNLKPLMLSNSSEKNVFDVIEGSKSWKTNIDKLMGRLHEKAKNLKNKQEQN